jgi:hypothetical protein
MIDFHAMTNANQLAALSQHQAFERTVKFRGEV